MLSELTREEFEEWELSDKLDGTISGMERLTRTLAEVGSVICATGQHPVELEPWQFIPGAEPPDIAETEEPSLEDLDANMRAWAAVTA